MQHQGRDARELSPLKTPKRRSYDRRFGVFNTALRSPFSSPKKLKVLISTSLCKKAVLVAALLLVPGGVLFSSFNHPSAAYAAPSTNLNFQARLLTNSGNLVPDGSYHIEFKLYKSLAAGSSAQGVCVGGVTDDCEWMETRTTGNLVTVVNGYFSVNLGSVTSFGSSIDWSAQHWLTMNIGGTSGPSWNGEMSPRIQLTAVPLAFMANNVNSGNTTANSTPSANTILQSGNTTGTTSNSGTVTLQSGNVTNGNSGNIIIDAGTASGTKGTISIAATNASSLLLGRTGFATTIVGGLTVTTGQNLIVNGDSFTDLTGTGLINSSGALSVDTTTASGFFKNGGNAFVANSSLGNTGNFDLNVLTNNLTRLTVQNDGDLAVDTDTLFVDATNNRVGIGNGSPSYTLDVTSPFSTANSSNNAARIVYNDSGSYSSGSVTKQGLFVDANYTGTITNSSGNGPTVTGIQSNATFNGSFSGTDNFLRLIGGTFNPVYSASAPTANDTVFLKGISSGVSSNLGTTGATQKVGAELIVNGTADINYGLNVNVGGATSNVAIGAGASSTSTTASDEYSVRGSISDTGVVTTGTDNTYGAQFTASRTGATGGTINTYGLDLQASGDNAGAGTSKVVGLQVTVSGTADTTYAALFNGGNVGIGTSTPSALLHVSGAGGGSDLFRVTDTTATAADVVKIADGGAATFKNQTDSTATFQIQNAAGNSLLSVDSTKAGNISVFSSTGGETGAWATTTALTAAREGTAVTYADGYAYSIGGANSGTLQTTVYYGKVNADGTISAWNTTTALGTATYYGMATYANGYIYFAGGCTAASCTGNTTNATYYAKVNADGTLGTWTSTTVLPGNVNEAAMTVANGYAYVMGGSSSGGNSQVNTVYYSKINANGGLGSWTSSGNTLPVTNRLITAAVANGYVYIIGGNISNGTGNTRDVYYAKLNTDGTVGSWTTVANAIPTALRGVLTIALNGYLYAIGGDSSTNDSASVTTISYAQLSGATGSIGAFSASTNALNTGRELPGGFTANGRIYAIGGWASSAASAVVEVASAKRLSVAGGLDLVGLTGQNLAEGNSGGQLTAGNTKIIGSLEVQDSASFNSSLSIVGNLTVQGDSGFAGNLLATGAVTTTTGTTSGTGGSNVTSITLSAAGSFANNDIIFVDNTGGSGQDYYTRITAGGGTTTLTVSPAVSYGTAAGYTGNATITKYIAQNIGATTTDYSTLNNRFFQGYFTGGIVTGAGSTTYSDQRIQSTGTLNINATATVVQNTADSATSFQVRNAAGSGVLTVDTSNNRLEVVGDILSKGTSWTARTSATSAGWSAVTYGNGIFVALSQTAGTANQVMTSPDGVVWTARSSSTDATWTSVTYGNGIFVAVSQTAGVANQVMTSTDGITWTARTSSTDALWISVTYGNGTFVAVSQTSGTANQVMTSRDGITWTARTSSTNLTWTSVTYGNGTFVAVSGGSTFMTSPDGITWTNSSAVPGSGGWTSVTYGNGIFVAVGSTAGTGNEVVTSPTGATWTARTSSTSASWWSVAYGNGLFVAVSFTAGTGNEVMTSPDGITWTARTSAMSAAWLAVTYGNGTFVAVSATSGTGNEVMTSGKADLTVTPTNNILQGGLTVRGGSSTNPTLTVEGDIVSKGTSWTSRSTTGLDNTWESVAYGNGLYVAVGITAGLGNHIMTSPDGINWTARTAAADNNWYSVTYGNGLFVAVAASGTGNRVMTSPDGITWTSRTSAADYGWESVTYGNGLFVAVALITGVGKNVMTSPDGITWTLRTTPNDLNWQSVTYGNGKFVAVAWSGTGNRVMTSPDGISWTAQTSAANSTWLSVTYGNGLFVAVHGDGNTSAVMTSPDGVTWNTRTTPSNVWGGVTYGNGLFVAVAYTGIGNRVMTSPDGITWTSRTSAAQNTWMSVGYGNGMFVAVSSDGTANRVMTSGKTDLTLTSEDTSVIRVNGQAKGLSVGSVETQALFKPKTDFTTGNSPGSVVIADFNNDGIQDIATANFGGNSISILVGTGNGNYAAKVDYTAGTNPFGIAAGDFNNDGKMDLVTSNNGTTTISVFINTGAGAGLFGASNPTPDTTANYSVGGTVANAVTTGDFNADGKTDIAATSGTSSGLVSVYLNSGLGGAQFGASPPTATTRVDYTTGNTPRGVVAGDFNKDGKVDLAVANSGTTTVTVFYNTGGGTGQFGASNPTPAFSQNSTVGTAPYNVVAADLNKDGYLDLAAVNNTSNTVSVLIGTAGSYPGTSTNYNVGTAPRGLAAGDFNKDGLIDLIATNVTSATFSVLMNVNSGTFAAKIDYSTGAGFQQVATGDLNNDGNLDAVGVTAAASVFLNAELGVTPSTYPTLGLYNNGTNDALSIYSQGTSQILRIDGRGSASIGGITPSGSLFEPKVDYTTGALPSDVAFGDFNKDGKQDMAVTSQTGGYVSVYTNKGDGTYNGKVDYTAGTTPNGVGVGDFNRDGYLDIAVVNYGLTTGGLSIFLNNGNGTFAAQATYTTAAQPYKIAIGDVNKDGAPDVVVANNNATSISVFTNSGTGTFGAKADSTTAAANPQSVALVDIDKDGDLDILSANAAATSTNGISIFLNGGTGTFPGTASSNLTTSSGPNALTSADFNKDGSPDIAVTNYNTGNVGVFINTGSGSFASQVTYTTAGGPNAIASADLDKDGNVDIVAINNTPGTVSLFRGYGTGTFAAKVDYTAGSSATSIAIADIDQDSDLDLGVANYNGVTVSTLANATNSPNRLNVYNSAGTSNLFNVADTGLTVNTSSTFNGNLTVGGQAASSIAPTTTNQTAGTFGSDTGRDSVTSMVVYNGKLYASAREQNSDNLAAIYRFDGGKIWTKVTDATSGKIISGDTANIDSIVMTVWNGKLYAGTRTGSVTNTGALYSYDGTTWSLIGTRGTFGAETNIDGIDWLTVYNGRIYLVTGETDLSSLYRYEGGTTYTRINATVGKGLAETADIDGGRLIEYDGSLWWGVVSGTTTGRVYKYDGNTLTLMNSAIGTFGGNGSRRDVTSMAVYNGQLYVATGDLGMSNTVSANIYVYKGGADRPGTPGDDWVAVNNVGSGILASGDGTQYYYTLATYNGRLYATSQTYLTNNAGALYEYGGNAGSANNWTLVNATRGTFGSDSSIDGVDSMVVYNGSLYLGTAEQAPNSDKASVYAYTKTQDNSYALQFASDTASTNLAQISFVGSQNSVGSSLNSGSFLFSHGINTTSGAYDLAEDYPTRDDSLVAGDIVSIDPNEEKFVQKGNSANAELIVGVYSTDPALRLSQKDATIDGARAVPIALAGRVPVKVSTENGPIMPGDPITISPTQPGVGVKAVTNGRIVGMSMGKFDGEGLGEVTVFINPSFYNLPTADLIQSAAGNFGGLNVSGNAVFAGDLTVNGEATITELTVTGTAKFGGDIKVIAPVNTRAAFIRMFKASEAIEPGQVVVLDEDHDGQVKVSTESGDTRVIGVAVTQALEKGDEIEVAMSGSVQVVSLNTQIKSGNLLVSSGTGSVDISIDPAVGSVLGKATSKPDTNHRLWILITLQ